MKTNGKLGRSTAKERARWAHEDELWRVFNSTAYRKACERQGKRNAARFAGPWDRIVEQEKRLAEIEDADSTRVKDGNEIAHITSEATTVIALAF